MGFLCSVYLVFWLLYDRRNFCSGSI
jgi:hypothetical protein